MQREYQRGYYGGKVEVDFEPLSVNQSYLLIKAGMLLMIWIPGAILYAKRIQRCLSATRASQRKRCCTTRSPASGRSGTSAGFIFCWIIPTACTRRWTPKLTTTRNPEMTGRCTSGRARVMRSTRVGVLRRCKRNRRQFSCTTAMHFSSIAIALGKLVTPTVVRQGCASPKYSA